MNYKQKSNTLLDFLSQLANDSEYSNKDRDKEIQILVRIYSDGFRHSYAKISTKIQTILEEDINKGECLSQNLQMIKKSIEKLTYDEEISVEICNKVRKLCDHVNLEIGRYNLIVNKIEERINVLPDRQNTGIVTNCSIDDLDKRITSIENKLSGVVNKAYEATKELEKVDGKLERNSMSSITTLTIFSAVILAFTGSITFTSGVFSGMSSVSPYRIVFVTSIIGAVVFNLIFMLLFIVGKMVGKNICCQCSYYNDFMDEKSGNLCGAGVCKKKEHIPNWGCVMIHKYPYILFVNITLGIIMYYDLMLFLINNPEFIFFITITDLTEYLLLFFPIILVLLICIFSRIKRVILCRRTVNAISLAIAEQYFDDEDGNVLRSVINRIAETISNLFVSKVGRKKEIEKILENMPDLDKKKRYKYLIRQLKYISKIKVIQGNKNIIKISFAENKYNKSSLKDTITAILDSYEKRVDYKEDEIDENIIDMDDNE